MTAKRILSGIFCIAILSLSFGQAVNLNAKLTKKKMYKDFDEFVQIIDSSTQTLVRKIATGYDAAEEIRQRRSQIEKIKSYGEFIHFLNECLPLTMAGHAQMTANYQRWGNSYIDTQIVVPLYQAYQKYVEKIPFNPIKNLKVGKGFYYKGGHYVDDKHSFINMENDTFFKQTIPFLDNTEFLIYAYSGSDAPDTNSLQYDGKIYILQDKFVFSSTGTLLANAQSHSQLVSVGEPTGLILGRGFPAGVFQLPESKFTFLTQLAIFPPQKCQKQPKFGNGKFLIA